VLRRDDGVEMEEAGGKATKDVLHGGKMGK
jgi:hypothetical protein